MDSFFKKFKFFPILAFSGSSKSEVLNQLQESGFQTLDLESLIGVEGACLAPITHDRYLDRAEFTANLISYLNSLDESKIIYVEWKSPHVLGYPLPFDFVETVRNSFSIVVDRPRSVRLANILNKYSVWNDHVDLIIEKLKSKNVSKELISSLRLCETPDEFASRILDWLDFSYQEEINKFKFKQYGDLRISNNQVYCLSSSHRV